MTQISNCVASLLENERDLLDAAVETLLKIADNILKDPTNERFRSVNLSSGVVERRLMPAVGALEILFLMGFEEADDRLVLPQSDPLDNVRDYRLQLLMLKEEKIKKLPAKEDSKAQSAAKNVNMQELEQHFKSQLENEFERVLVYESPSLQEKARQVMPVQALHEGARAKLAVIDRGMKQDEKPLDFQDCVLVELLEWFREKFFSWFNSPTCRQCQKIMSASAPLPPTQDDLLWGGNRVEGYVCSTCGASERFVRYNHPAKLLETRTGRCGEWANCFTLLCRTLGMDARYVHDYTDHVWTEVYSQSQGRWLHADPCENKMDTPLLYEVGWKKNLTYIIAYSKDEAVDVTWRYSMKRKETLKRRKNCRESWLVSTLMEMSKKRQAAFPPAKKQFLEQRLVREIAEFFAEPRTLKESESGGRISGSLAWRLARGETQTGSNYTFKITPQEAESKAFLIKYSPAKDEYVRVNAGEKSKGWQSRVNSAKNIFRKHEPDWKFVYLARTEGSDCGEISWKVDWSESGLKAASILVVLNHKTYENGSVHWQLCTGDKCFTGNQEGVLELNGNDLEDEPKKLEVSATLENGKGNCAWQHSQLFRQPDSSLEQFPFLIHIKFI